MIDAIRQAGGEPQYTELAGVGHDSWTPAYTDPDRPAAVDVRAAKSLTPAGSGPFRAALTRVFRTGI